MLHTSFLALSQSAGFWNHHKWKINITKSTVPYTLLPVGLFNQTQSWFFYEAFSQTAITVRRLLIHNYPPLTIASYPFIQVSELTVPYLISPSLQTKLLPLQSIHICHIQSQHQYFSTYSIVLVSRSKYCQVLFPGSQYLYCQNPILHTRLALQTWHKLNLYLLKSRPVVT